MERGRGAAEKKATDDVVVTVASTGEDVEVDKDDSHSFSRNPQLGNSSSPSPAVDIAEVKNLNLIVPNSTLASSPSLEMAKFSPNATPSKPPKTPTEATLTNRRTFSSTLSKSRFTEPPSPRGAKSADEKAPAANSASPSATPSALETPDEGDDEGVYNCANLKVCGKNVGVLMLVELIAFVFIMGALIPSLTVNTLEDKVIWGLKLWKWCVLVLVIFCGRLFSAWSINVVVLLIERNFLLRNKVLYFVYGVKKSVQVFIWLCLVLLAWILLINRGVERSKDTTRILSYVTRALGALLVGAAIWLIKTLLIKIIASSYQCTRFFERMQESIFHQYVVKTLSMPLKHEKGDTQRKSFCCKGLLCFIDTKKEKEVKIDVVKLSEVKPGKVSAWTMKGLVDVIRGSRLSTVSDTLEGYDEEQQNEKIGSEKQAKDKIDSEKKAKAAADRIFRNVAKPEAENMEEKDLLLFMKGKNVDKLLHVFGATETKKIGRSDFQNWLVSVYVERKSLAHSLNDAKTAIEELNRLLSAIVLVLAVIVWLIIMGFLTTQILVLISSQLLLAAFIFGNAAKTAFEAIIFVFVMHPFDVHDRCVIDGIQMVVEEMNILNTIFLRYDGEKIFYPNSVLSTKPISNYYRSPEMGDSVLFDIHISTSAESILALNAKIQVYLESKPEHWRADFTLLVKEIENVNKMKMALYVTHTMNFQEYLVKSIRRSELVLELKKCFEELGIEYHLLPQEVHVRNIGTTITTLAR